MTHGDRDRERYRLWCAGKLAPGERAPLLTRDEVLAEVNAMMEAWRDHNSEGTDMHGLTPRAVFVQNSPRNGFRRISDDDLAFATAEHFQNEHIAQGGIIELRDGSRYSHPLLIGLAGQKREVVRLRHNHDFITVLPAQKGEETIRANRRGRMGMNDPDELARQMEMQNRLNKLAGAFTKPREYEPGAQMPVAQEPPSAPAAFQAEPEGPPPNGDNEVSAAAYFMEHQRPEKPPKGRGLAYLED